MNLPKKLLFIYFFMLFSYLNVNAQHMINLPTIDLIAYDEDAEFAMFEEIGHNAYTYTVINFGDTTEGFLYTLLGQEPDEVYTLEDIKEDYANIVYVSEIQPNATSIWKQYDWFLQTEDTSEEEVTILKFTENGLAYYQELLFQDISTEKNDAYWEMDETVWLEVIVLNFGNGKEIILLNEEDDIVFMGIPLYNQMIMTSEEIDIINTTSIEKNSYAVNEYETLNYFEPNYTYKIVKDGTQQYRLYDNFKNDLLQMSFDTIMYNNYFIVGQKGTEYSMYNSVLTKFEIPNVRKAYIRDTFLEFLTTDTAAYIDIFGNQFQSLSQRIYGVCGTVSSERHQIIKDEDQKYPYSVKVIHKKIGYNPDTEETYIFTNHKKNQVLTFINDTTANYSDGNDEFTNAISGFPAYLKVFDGKKYGLLSYDTIHHDRTLKTTVSDQYSQNRQVYNDLFVKTIKELPVKYDSITVNQDNLILFYKNTNVGIFPHHKKPQYDLFERVTESFYKITKNGKNGWLDVKAMEEFLF